MGINEITLHQLIPSSFPEEGIHSDIWLQDVCFVKGKNYLIEAASGTGKTSLCSFLYGERLDWSGEIAVDGQDLRRFSPADLSTLRRESISIVFQDLKLFPELSALENVQVKNQLTDYRSSDEIRQLFSALDLEDKMHSPAKILSWGQQQRVALIRSLCQPFDFIILDEPISHLDETNAGRVSSLLQEELDSRGASAIVTSLGLTLPLNYAETLML